MIPYDRTGYVPAKEDPQAQARHEAAFRDLNKYAAQTPPVMTAHDLMTLRAVAEDQSLSGFVRLEVYRILVSHLAPATGSQLGTGMVAR